MDFKLSTELKMLQKEIRKFAKKQIEPFADQWDEDHHLPIDEVMRPLGELGYFGTVIPEEYGGLGMTAEEEMHLAFALGQTSPAFRSLLGTNNGIGSQGIVIDAVFVAAAEAEHARFNDLAHPMPDARRILPIRSAAAQWRRPANCTGHECRSRAVASPSLR